ncbi:hypothetical protein [Candidatus Clavichlamydia salmonicola]|nr:hypothetical protein [Candidatus Clavichlamydia salmonicola]
MIGIDNGFAVGIQSFNNNFLYIQEEVVLLVGKSSKIMSQNMYSFS